MKRYGATEALSAVSFVVEPGEVFGLLGVNGAGKTTALECLLGLRTPDAGEIWIGAHEITREPAAARAQLGAQLQDSVLPDKITPREAVGLFAALQGVAEPVAELLARFGLEANADARFETLSGGMRRRVLLALAWLHRPEVLVLDEPTAGLDVLARRELHTLIRTARAEGRTVLLSTHDLEEAASLCDRIGILHGGRLVACGTPDELVRRNATTSQIRVRTNPTLSVSTLAQLPGVRRCERQEPATLLVSSDLTATVAAFGRLLPESGVILQEFRVDPPTLEDAFVSLTGQPWRTGEGES